MAELKDVEAKVVITWDGEGRIKVDTNMNAMGVIYLLSQAQILIIEQDAEKALGEVQ